jgi:hypothetical protein
MIDLDCEVKSALWNGVLINYMPGTLFLSPKRDYNRAAYDLIYELSGNVVSKNETGELEVAVPSKKTLQIAAELSKTNMFRYVRLLVPELSETT